MKELLVEEAQLGHAKVFGDAENQGTGNFVTAQNAGKIGVINSVSSTKAFNRAVFPPCSFLYNLPYGGSHGREYYISQSDKLQPENIALRFQSAYICHKTSLYTVPNWETLPKWDTLGLMHTGERIRFLRKELKLSQKEFATKIGISQNFLSEIEKGKKQPSEKVLRLISHTFNVSYEWLKEGKGEMFVKPKPNARIIPEEEIVWVPIVARVGAGYPLDQGDVEVRGHFPIPRYVWESLPKGTFTVEVHGDSMEPTLHEGDVVAAKPYEGTGDDIPNNKIVIVADESGELMVKRIQRFNNTVFLVSDNPKYQPMRPSHGYRIIGIGIRAWKGVEL